MQKKVIFLFILQSNKRINNENDFLQIDDSEVSLYKVSPEMRMANYKNIIKFWPKWII